MSERGENKVESSSPVESHEEDSPDHPENLDEETSSPGPVYEFIDPDYFVENVERYQSGGFHPARIGDKIHGSRYKIVHKLGHGGFSTIWLAQDRARGDKYVALKITAADAINDTHELDVLNLLGKPAAASSSVGDDTLNGQAKRGQHILLTLLDSFIIEGPNGRHRCFVSGPLRCSVQFATLEAGLNVFSLESARAIVAQLILALNFVHSNGVAHGDLWTANVLFRLPALGKLTRHELYERYCAPVKTKLERTDEQPCDEHAPQFVVSPIPWRKKCDEITLAESEIVLSDFGESWEPAKEQKDSLGTPLPFIAPEDRFDPDDLGLPADIWSLACTIFHVMCGDDLFPTWLNRPDDIAEAHVRALGKYPDDWWPMWKTRLNFFLEDGTPLKVPMLKPERLGMEGRMDYLNEVRGDADAELLGDQERDDLQRMLQMMLVYKPGRRCSAAALVESDWMKNWGWPALAKLDAAVAAAKDTAADAAAKDGETGDGPVGTQQAAARDAESSTAEWSTNAYWGNYCRTQ